MVKVLFGAGGFTLSGNTKVEPDEVVMVPDAMTHINGRKRKVVVVMKRKAHDEMMAELVTKAQPIWDTWLAAKPLPR